MDKSPDRKTGKRKFLSLLNWIGASFILILTVLIVFSNVTVENAVGKYVYENIDDIPCNEYGLLLGTSKTIRGKENLYFTDRMNATAELYHKGKIKYIIASGALSPPHYNGPENMKRALIARRIPADRIIKDGYGYRTLDSIYRTADVFGIKRFTVISQYSHITRAIYIARYSRGLDVIGFAADNGRTPYLSFYDRAREYLAKVKMMLDIYILNTEAKFPNKKLDE
ncbi:MAG: ElyC/SanA/YdcF family protein [Victivallales bacterium]|nr:ElyC/SanA/YdcF family protein [Victivallales bacterium]